MTSRPTKFLKRILPKSLLGRSLIILVTPLVVVQVVLGYMFFGRHTDAVLDLIAENIAGDVQMVNDLLDNGYDFKELKYLAEKNLYLEIDFLKGNQMERYGSFKNRWLYHYLQDSLNENLNNPYFLKIDDANVLIDVKRPDGVLKVSLPRKRFFSRTTPLVIIWTALSAVFLFIVSSIFMRNQIRPIRLLAEAAERFGKGEDMLPFRPEGATEVRKAGLVFNIMRDRLRRHLRERTDMLAGVSHDLRTPLARMKLQLAMMPRNQDVMDLEQDVRQMQQMLQGFLDFARGSSPEEVNKVNIQDLGSEIAHDFRHSDLVLKVECSVNIAIPLKKTLFKRCLTNLLINSERFARSAWLTFLVTEKLLTVYVDDDGPGICEQDREIVMRPFYRSDQARNLDSTNVGLGLSIARDVVTHHGGTLELASAPQGGLRVIIKIPY